MLRMLQICHIVKCPSALRSSHLRIIYTLFSRTSVLLYLSKGHTKTPVCYQGGNKDT